MKEKETFKERLRERAIKALLGSRSIAAAAKKVRLSERTLRRWLNDEQFYSEYLAAKKDLLRAGIGRLTQGVYDAAGVLIEIARHKGRKFQAPRAHAAANIVKLSLDADLADNFERRLLALEKQGRSNEKFQID